MVKDRLAELRAAVKDEAIVEANVCDKKSAEFFKEVEEIKQVIEKIESDVKFVKRSQLSILCSPNFNAKEYQKVEHLIAGVKHKATNVRMKLNEIRHSNERYGQKNVMSANYRIRKVQHSMLTQNYVIIMNEFMKTQTDYREKCKAKIKKQLIITGVSASADEIEDMLDSGHSALTTVNALRDTQQAKQELAEIKARHDDMIRLEKTIRELYDLFLDMSLIVDTQGVEIERIEDFVSNAAFEIKRGKNKIKGAVKCKRKLRKRKIFSVAAVSGTVIGAVAAILAILL